MKILLILIPAPIVGYLLIDHVRKLFSEDDTAVRRLFAEQPVTMIAAATALGAIAVWGGTELARRIWTSGLLSFLTG